MVQNTAGNKVPCAIQADGVSERTCRDLQVSFSAERCFGCASPWRLCMGCRERIVAFPEIPYCSDCLESQLEKETGQSSVRGVPICTQCQQRPIRFKDYGFCLHCTVQQYSPENRAAQAEREPSPSPRRKRRRRSTLPLETGLGSELYRHAVEIAVRDGSVTNAKLMQELQIQHGVAKRILDAMHSEGIIGPPSGPKPRRTLVGSSPQPVQLPARTGSPLNSVLAVNPLDLDQLLGGESEDAQANRMLLQLGLKMIRDRVDQIGEALYPDKSSAE